MSDRCALHLHGEHSSPPQVRATWRSARRRNDPNSSLAHAPLRQHPSRSTARLTTLHEPWGGPPGVSVTSQAVEQMSGDVQYLDQLLRVSKNRAGVLQCGESADGYWMTNGDVQVIVALLLMVQRARRIEVGLHGRAEHGHKVAGVIGDVVLVDRRSNDHQWRIRCNRSCTSSMRQRELSGAHGLRHGACGMVLAAHNWRLMGRNSPLWLVTCGSPPAPRSTASPASRRATPWTRAGARP
jgi:hypothetical protein